MSTWRAVDEELDRAGVVLDLVAVRVVDGAPVDDTLIVEPFAIVCVTVPVELGGGGGVVLATVAVTVLLGEHGAGAVDGAHLEGVRAVR